jgi:hypothetical protein
MTDAAIAAAGASSHGGPLDEVLEGEDGALGHAAAVGALVGFIVTAGMVLILGLVIGVETPSALGLGCFVGLWGGTGFGFMTAGSVTAARHEAAQSAAQPAVSEPPAG